MNMMRKKATWVERRLAQGKKPLFARDAGFDPNQERDEHGRWSGNGNVLAIRFKKKIYSNGFDPDTYDPETDPDAPDMSDWRGHEIAWYKMEKEHEAAEIDASIGTPEEPELGVIIKGEFRRLKDAQSNDPSGTDPLQKLFWADAKRRWIDVERSVREGLKTYDFVGVGDRVQPFRNWLESLISQHVIGSGAWMNNYLNKAASMADSRARGLTLDYAPDQPRDDHGRWTNTETFKNWFGNSKVVTKEGKPMVMYHGTRSDFEAFEKTNGGNAYGEGYYFTEDPSKASDYALGENVSRITLEGNAGPNVVPVYLSAQKPFEPRGLLSKSDVDALEAATNKLNKGYFKKGELWKTFDTAYPAKGDNVLYQLPKDYYPILKEAGYDSIRTPDYWVTFHSNQIKSAIGNKGTFNPSSKKITDADLDWMRACQDHAVSELRGIADATVQQVTRAMTNALLARKNPTNDILSVIRKVGQARTKMLINYSVMKVFSVATLEAFRAAGHTQVGIIPEKVPHIHVGDAARKTVQPRGKNGKFRAYTKISAKNRRKAEKQHVLLKELGRVNVMTAEDDRVCNICEDIADGGPYGIDHAMSLIPAHINCRCVFIPVGRLPMNDALNRPGWRLSMDEFGKFHWLMSLPELDPLFLQQYYHEQWLEKHKLKDMNPYHVSAGSPQGGQFTHAPGDRAALIEKRKALLAQMRPLAEKGNLTGSEAEKFIALGHEMNAVHYDLLKGKPFTGDKVKSEAERMSTLPTDIVVTAMNDVLKNRDAFMAIHSAAFGTENNALTDVDKMIEAGRGKEIYDAFSDTRAALKEKFGPSIKLYRAEGMQRTKPTKNWATTREYAAQFGAHVVSADIPIDNILAVNVGTNGNYHEMIVLQTPIKDAGFDPNQDRDEYGRWTREGQIKLGAKAEWIRTKIDDVADQLDFPKDRIHMSTGTYMFELNGNQYRAGGIAIHSNNEFTQPDTGEKYGKGEIVIYGDKDKGFDEDMPIRPLVAHEIQHQMFNQVLDNYSTEMAHLYRHNSDKMDLTNFRPKEEALEDIKGSYPTLYALGKLGWDSDALFNKLEEEDGVTWYSKQYWDAAGEHRPGSRKLAINETLAEIASLTEEGEARIWDKDTGKQMTEHLRNWLKSEYEKEGASFASPEEHAAQMEDPWAYSEMMEDTPGDDAFRKKFGTKLHNIKGFRMGGEPIYYRPIFTDYPDPVISPTWQKLFAAFRSEYHRITKQKLTN